MNLMKTIFLTGVVLLTAQMSWATDGEVEYCDIENPNYERVRILQPGDRILYTNHSSETIFVYPNKYTQLNKASKYQFDLFLMSTKPSYSRIESGQTVEFTVGRRGFSVGSHPAYEDHREKRIISLTTESSESSTYGVVCAGTGGPNCNVAEIVGDRESFDGDPEDLRVPFKVIRNGRELTQSDFSRYLPCQKRTYEETPISAPGDESNLVEPIAL